MKEAKIEVKAEAMSQCLSDPIGIQDHIIA